MDKFIKGTTIKIVDYNSWVIVGDTIVRYNPKIHQKYLEVGEVYTLSVAVKIRKERR
jgi:hypothetical protein